MTTENAELINAKTYQLSPLSISMIVCSVIASFIFLFLVFLFIKRSRRNKEDVEDPAFSLGQSSRKILGLFKPNTDAPSVTPITSSLDSHDIFSSLLDYPPSIVPSRLNHSQFDNDPISLSLTRQNIEERAGYYKSPTRNPVPYNCSKTTLTNPNNHLTTRNTDVDEDIKEMQRWSAFSYHVW